MPPTRCRRSIRSWTGVGGVSLTRLLGTTDYNVINPQNDLTRADSEKLNLYVGRLNTLLEDMDEAGQVAVFYPIATVQALHDADSAHGSESGNKRSASDRLDSGFQALCRTLLQNDYLYSVLDDDSLCGATVANDGCLCVGAGAYRTVVVPFAQYISVDALSRLVAFRQAGGTVIFVGDKPVHGLAAGQDADIAGLMAQLADSPYLSKNDSRLTAVLADSVRRRSRSTVPTPLSVATLRARNAVSRTWRIPQPMPRRSHCATSTGMQARSRFTILFRAKPRSLPRETDLRFRFPPTRQY